MSLTQTSWLNSSQAATRARVSLTEVAKAVASGDLRANGDCIEARHLDTWMRARLSVSVLARLGRGRQLIDDGIDLHSYISQAL